MNELEQEKAVSPKITLDSLESVSKEEYEQIGAEFKGGIGRSMN